jgi:REP element-mobilizing transposase RayT
MKSSSHYAREYAEFITITCLDWKPLLADDSFKDIIIGSLDFLTKIQRLRIYAFVIMSNHFHLIWQMLGDHKRRDVQRDFLKFTAQQILVKLQSGNSPLRNELQVNKADRKFQVWQRNALAIPLWTDKVIWQKLEYIHANPVHAGLCRHAELYEYSSAAFYLRGDRRWSFLTHIDG